jgi:hypothetical protein
MGQLVAGMLSSHAFTFVDPEHWEERRARTRANFERFNHRPPPPERPEIATEDPANNTERFDMIRQGLARLRSAVRESHPNVLLLIGDDQNENYTTANLPQFSIFVGESFTVTDPETNQVSHYRAEPDVAARLLREGVDAGFDLASTDRFADDRLRSHAHCEPLRFLDAAADVAVVPIFLNAIHVPAPSPTRCYALGQQLRRSIDRLPDEHRVAMYASGGFSHFTAGYPWNHYEGGHTLGSIARDFDAQVVASLRAGRGSELVALTSGDLLDNGAIELRQSILLAGAIGDVQPAFFEYQAFFRAVLGMAVGLWQLEDATPRKANT